MSSSHALIIDDDIYSIKVLGELLAMAGLSYTAVQDPAQLGEIENLEQAAVVFLDLEMPTYNGYEVFEILRNDFGIGAPIVACTVHTSEINVVKKSGFHSFLGKPLKAERFQQQLEKILRNQPVWEMG